MKDKININVVVICVTILIIFITLFTYNILSIIIKKNRIEKCVISTAKQINVYKYFKYENSNYINAYSTVKNFCLLKFK